MSTLIMGPSPLTKAIASLYNSSTSYVVGDFCSLDGKIYKCTATTTGTFDPTKWTETFVMNEVDDKLNANLGSENAGKFLTVDNSGNIVATSMNTWQGGSY